MKLKRGLVARILCTVMTLGAVAPPTLADFDKDFRFWNTLLVQQYKDAKWSTFTYAEARWIDDANKIGAWVAQQKLYYQWKPNLSLGVGPGWIELKDADGGWNTLARMEFEINPSWQIGNQSRLSLRNRLETRWWESRDYQTELVSRHRLHFSRPGNWLPGMTHFGISNEFFFDYRVGAYKENRFRPIQISFDAGERKRFNLFLQVRSMRSGDGADWKHAYILGCGFNSLARMRKGR